MRHGGTFEWWLERVHPADRERFAREVDSFLDSGDRQALIEYRYRRASGEYVPVRDQVVVERGGDGTPLRFVAVVEERIDPPLSRTPYQDLFERTRDAVFTVDDRGRLQVLNPAGLALLGLTPATARDRPLSDFYQDGGAAENLLAELRARGQVADREARLVSDDGRELRVRVSAVATFGAGGDHVGHQVILHEVGRPVPGGDEPPRAPAADGLGKDVLRALRRISERLAAAERLDPGTLAGIVDLVPSGFRFPELARARVAASGQEAVGEGFDPAGALVCPVCDGPGAAAAASVSVSYGASPEVDPEAPFTPEESDFLGEVALRIGETARRIRAVEARRRDEAYRRTLVERSQDLLAILDRDLTVRYASPAAERLLGYEPGSLAREHALDLIHPDDRALAAEALAEAAADPGAAPTIEHRVRHADGSWRTFESTGQGFLDDPDIQGIVVNSRDITDRKALEDQLLHSQKMEVVGRLAGGLAQEFNNLLTVIQVSARLLEDLFEGEVPEELQDIETAAATASMLTRRLLAFSGRGILRPRSLELGRLLEELSPFLTKVVGKSVALHLSPPPRPLRILADAGQMEQVILELSENARAAMPSGGVLTIEARTAGARELPRQIRRPEEWAILRVSDTGSGIPDDVRSRIFEPFFTTKPSGTGLGLATVRGIVSRLGGVVDVVSSSGEGTTFAVCLPTTRGAEATPLSLPEPAPEPAASPVFPTGRAILLVEPDAATRSVSERALSAHGYRVLEAEDGVAALTLVEAYQGTLDLLVTALEMPGVDGEALAARLLILHPEARVLYLGSTEGASSREPVLPRDGLPGRLVEMVDALFEGATPA